jgi:hypothetical protein
MDFLAFHRLLHEEHLDFVRCRNGGLYRTNLIEAPTRLRSCPGLIHADLASHASTRRGFVPYKPPAWAGNCLPQALRIETSMCCTKRS